MSRTLEEIEAEIKTAHATVSALNLRLAELRKEKADVTVANSGLLGHIVSYTKSSWRNRDGAEVRFLVEGVSRWGGPSLRGRMIKKDGSLGVKEIEASASTLIDHGLYVAPERSK